MVLKVSHDLVFSAIVVTPLFGAVGDLQLRNQKFEEAGRFHHIHKQKIPSSFFGGLKIGLPSFPLNFNITSQNHPILTGVTFCKPTVVLYLCSVLGGKTPVLTANHHYLRHYISFYFTKSKNRSMESTKNMQS